MNALDRKRMELDLVRVRAARAELEFKIFEREEDIKRMQDNVAIQIAKEQELEAQLKGE